MKINGVLYRSDRAIEAEANGRYPLLQACRKLKGILPQLTQSQCRSLLEIIWSGEWHHLGKMANEVKYYDVGEAVQLYVSNPDAAKAEKKKPSLEKKVLAHIEWTEWSGFRRKSRLEKRWLGWATVKGDWISFDGNRKKLSGKWINVRCTVSP